MSVVIVSGVLRVGGFCMIFLIWLLFSQLLPSLLFKLLGDIHVFDSITNQTLLKNQDNLNKMSAICDAIGPLVRGSSRLIFVVLCAGLAGAQVLYMINISGYGLVNSMAPGVAGGAHYLLAIGFFLLAALGAYATLIGHREHLKAVSMIATITHHHYN